MDGGSSFPPDWDIWFVADDGGRKKIIPACIHEK
jgi:hypothetical protein